MSSFSRSLAHNARILLSLVPAIRDGQTEAIHDARVATRRLRAALDVVASHQASSRFNQAIELVRKVGRALGRARDVDVSLGLLSELERRATGTEQPIAVCRAEAEGSMLYERFLEHRTELRSFCAQLTASQPYRRSTGALLTIGAAAAGSLWQLRRARAG